MNNNTINNISFLLQLYSLEILLKDYNNSDLMQELQTQDLKLLISGTITMLRKWILTFLREFVMLLAALLPIS